MWLLAITPPPCVGMCCASMTSTGQPMTRYIMTTPDTIGV